MSSPADPFRPGSEVRVVRALPDDFFDGLTFPPLVVRPGERVDVQDDPGSGIWPAFVLVENAQGTRGWIPRRVLGSEGGGTVVVASYDTTTLDPPGGESLVVVETDRESGWLWCRDPQGRLGWFPIDHVALVD